MNRVSFTNSSNSAGSRESVPRIPASTVSTTSLDALVGRLVVLLQALEDRLDLGLGRLHLGLVALL